MAPRKNPHWEAPKFSFNSQNQAEECKFFYTRALVFFEALDINPDEEDQGRKERHQRKIMFEGDVHQVLQMMIDYNTILPEAKYTPSLAINAIQSVIKDVHFLHYHDEILSDLQQLPDEGIDSLNNCFNTLVSKCKFISEETKEVIKIMLLQHTVKHHEARDWIHLQD